MFLRLSPALLLSLTMSAPSQLNLMFLASSLFCIFNLHSHCPLPSQASVTFFASAFQSDKVSVSLSDV